jgi:hypothetical protein
VAAHAEYALGGSCVSEILNLTFAVSAAEASCTESLVARENGQILNFVSTRTAAVCAIVADEGSVAKEEEVRVRVEKGSAGVASKAIQMPSIASCQLD